MNTHDVLLTIQYITITVLFAELLVVFLKWKNSIHSYLFLTCIASFISNMGYLLEMKAGSEGAFLSALKLSYVGRVWIVFTFFLFSAKMCGKKLPRGLVYALIAVHVGVYATVLTIGSNTLYYSDYSFIDDPVFPRLIHGNGVTHDLLIGMNVIFIVIGMLWVIRAYRREKNRTARMRLLMLVLALGVQSASLILHISNIFGLSGYYDLTMAGTLLGNVFLLVGIFRFDLLGTREIAKDFVVDRISEGIIAVDNEGRIRYFNEPAAKLYPEFDLFYAGQTGRDEAVSANDASSQTNERPASQSNLTPYDIVANISEAVENGRTLKVGDRIYTPEENDLTYKGESYGKLYALVDDTEHFRYMEELERQKEIADSANEAKSRFLASMSHEIRTPINAVLGMDEMILRESEEESTRAYASDIMSAGRTLLSLINDILDLSKVEEGKMEIIPVQYDLSSLVGDLFNMIRDRAAKKGLKFNVSVDEHIPHSLIGDEIRIRQCVMNLLTNAVKYTETGEVTLTVGYEKKDGEQIYLAFKVEDTGIGMKPEDMDKLFSPYSRIEEKRNRHVEGTGLGMSITRQLLELMGSKLDVKSEYGVGSVFSFAVEQEVAGWEEIGRFTPGYGDREGSAYEYRELFHAEDARILVVDDTEMNLTVIESLLKKTRIGIDTASSGREAIARVRDNLYDAVFIDHMMPDMDGIETLKHLRDVENGKSVPCVALTANAVSGAREMYLNAGFTAYLSKPVDGEKLERLLKDMLPPEKVHEPVGESAVKGEDFAGRSFEDEGREEKRTSKESSGSAEGPASDVLERIGSIESIDINSGVKNTGSKEGYLSVISVFHKTARTKADEIENLIACGDIENYTVKVHALKSSARIIGAGELSALAAKLEEAGKSGDLSFIKDNTDGLLAMYRELDGKLSCLDKADEDLPPIAPEELKDAYLTIVEAAGSMDFGMVEDVLKSLHEYRLPEADGERIERIERFLTELDWDGIEGEARGV